MRLIDADELYIRFKNSPSDTEEEKEFNQIGRYFVRHAPTVDAGATGEWIPKKEMIRSICAKNYICSHCGEDGSGTKYCPNCGAQMSTK